MKSKVSFKGSSPRSGSKSYPCGQIKTVKPGKNRKKIIDARGTGAATKGKKFTSYT